MIVSAEIIKNDKKHTIGQQASEKVLIFINHQGNVN
jgi:hypothetical protein